MNKLINITTNEQGSQVVSARELHEFLDVSTQFRTWMPRMIDYGFEEGVDFERVTKNVRGQDATEYAITLDMAKELSMIQRSEKGKQARKYFIDCEKSLKLSIPKKLTEKELLTRQLALLNENEELNLLVSIQQKDIAINKPKVQLADHIMADDVTTHKVGQAAKILEGRGIPIMGSKNLYKFMRGLGMVFKGSTEPMQSSVNKGYLALKVNEIVGSNGCHIIKKQTLVTNKGIEYLFKKLYKKPCQEDMFK